MGEEWKMLRKDTLMKNQEQWSNEIGHDVDRKYFDGASSLCVKFCVNCPSTQHNWKLKTKKYGLKNCEPSLLRQCMYMYIHWLVFVQGRAGSGNHYLVSAALMRKATAFRHFSPSLPSLLRIWRLLPPNNEHRLRSWNSRDKVRLGERLPYSLLESTTVWLERGPLKASC
jgi:hypothetical protein